MSGDAHIGMATIALVFFVIFDSSSTGSKEKLLSRFTKTGKAPKEQIASTGATKVHAVVITSSPGPIPAAAKAQ